MAVRIRLRRMGRKKKPHYRIVVTDRTAPRDGRFVESIGYYKPLVNPARLVLDLERVDFWISQGATPSDTVSSLIRKARAGGDDSLAFGQVSPEEEKARKAETLAAKRKAEAEIAAAEEAAAAEPEAEAEAAVQPEAAESPETSAKAEAATEPEAATEAGTEAAAEAGEAAKPEATGETEASGEGGAPDEADRPESDGSEKKED